MEKLPLFKSWFRRNAGPWPGIDWEKPLRLPDEIRQPLGKSLAVFQLGETGDGRTLRRYAARVADDPALADYPETLLLFIREENRHAEVLARIVRRLGVPLREKQWTNAVFKFLRRPFNLDFEIQILLTAELIAEAYYALLYKRVTDEPVATACGRMVREEKWHTRFHAEFFGYRQRPWPSWLQALWRIQFRAIHRIVREVVWRDHRACFHALEIKRADFFRLGGKAERVFLEGIRDASSRPTALAAESSQLTP